MDHIIGVLAWLNSDKNFTRKDAETHSINITAYVPN